MKKIVKIGFPIVCITVVGGTLIALSNLKGKAEQLSKENANKVSNSYNEENTYNTSHRYQNLDGIDENEISNNVSNVNNSVENKTNTNTENTNTTVNNTNTLSNTKNQVTTSTNSKSEESETSLDNTSDKDKAIALVEEEWGTDSSVYYTNEGVSSGLYIVAVRDKSNTSVKMFYKVDLKNNTVEIDW